MIHDAAIGTKHDRVILPQPLSWNMTTAITNNNNNKKRFLWKKTENSRKRKSFLFLLFPSKSVWNTTKSNLSLICNTDPKTQREFKKSYQEKAQLFSTLIKKKHFYLLEAEA